MKRKTVMTIAPQCLMFTVLLCATWHAQGQVAKAANSSMAPIDQYLIADGNAEIALARSAAPLSISRDAKVLVLGRHGYKTAVEGKNGFVCVVERAWMSPFDSKQFWDPKMRGPICFNPEAARSILPMTLKRTELVLAGQSKGEILKSMKASLEKKQLPALEPGAMSYMMSKEGHIGKSDDHWIPHLMFYTPVQVDWGADLKGSPVMLNPQFAGAPEPVTVFMIPVGNWSDGSTAQ